MTAPPLVQELKGLLPAPLVVETLETFKDMLRAAGAAPEAEVPDVDALVDALRTHDRSRLGQVYDAMRETDVFRRIVTAWTPLTLSGAANGGVDVVETTEPHLYPVDVRVKREAQVRFGDLLAPEVIARGWRNRRADGFEAFAALHPDLIASKEHP